VNIEDAAQRFFIRGIPANAIDRFWPFAEPYVKRALDHTSGEFTPEDVKQLCKDRVVQLWLISENSRVIAAATTEIVIYPNRKHCRIATIGGSKAPEWSELLFNGVIAEWAKEQGCVAIEAFVRKGYVPVLAEYGFKHKYSAVIKEL
jgi:hypothetical protein